MSASEYRAVVDALQDKEQRLKAKRTLPPSQWIAVDAVLDAFLEANGYVRRKKKK